MLCTEASGLVVTMPLFWARCHVHCLAGQTPSQLAYPQSSYERSFKQVHWTIPWHAIPVPVCGTHAQSHNPGT